MAREIIVLDAIQFEGGGERQATVVFWLVAPTNRVRPLPNGSPLIPPSTTVDPANGVSWGYTAAELTAVRNGTVVAEMATISEGEILAVGPLNLANFRTAAGNKFTSRQNALNATAIGIKTIGMARDGGAWGPAP